jgi:hypothetical protein
MRIIKNNTFDYYDTVSSFGIDTSCIYDRKSTNSEIPISIPSAKRDYLTRLPDLYNNETSNHRFTKFITGFCGELYPLVRVEDTTVGGEFLNGTLIHKKREPPLFFYDKSFIDYRQNLYGIEETKNRRYYYWDKREYDNFFDPNTWKDYQKYFIELKVPVFVVFYNKGTHKNNLVTNPVLKDFEFYKIKDSATAFQSIHQFISGVLGQTEVKTLEISDEVKKGQAGFDDFSFKQPPDKKGDKKRPKKWR